MSPLDRSETDSNRATSRIGFVAGLWGILGFVLLVTRALISLSSEIVDVLAAPLVAWQWITFGTIVLAIGGLKGYFIFQLRFCPSYASRVGELNRPNVNLLHAVLAPLYCLNLIGAEKRERTRGILTVLAIFSMIVTARFVPFPWRGMILLGVVTALSWAAIATIVFSIRFMRRTRNSVA